MGVDLVDEGALAGPERVQIGALGPEVLAGGDEGVDGRPVGAGCHGRVLMAQGEVVPGAAGQLFHEGHRAAVDVGVQGLARQPRPGLGEALLGTAEGRGRLLQGGNGVAEAGLGDRGAGVGGGDAPGTGVELGGDAGGLGARVLDGAGGRRGDAEEGDRGRHQHRQHDC